MIIVALTPDGPGFFDLSLGPTSSWVMENGLCYFYFSYLIPLWAETGGGAVAYSHLALLCDTPD